MQCFTNVADYARRNKLSLSTVHRYRKNDQLAYLQLHRPFIPIEVIFDKHGKKKKNPEDEDKKPLVSGGVEGAVVAISQLYPSVIDQKDMKRIFGLRCDTAVYEVIRYLQLETMNGLKNAEYLRIDLIIAISQVYERQVGVDVFEKMAAAEHQPGSLGPVLVGSCAECGRLYD